jgi:hypothetical protein
MKRIFTLSTLILFCSLVVNAQSGRPGIDKSPLDMSYYPANYPVLKIQDKVTEPIVARVIYSRPKKEGRAVFGGLVSYGKVWRLGANEATEIEFYRPVTIGGKKISVGKYTIYALVNEKKWTFILNKEIDTWGAFKYDPAKDIIRTEVSVEQTTETIESLVMGFKKIKENAISLVIEWENIKAALPISL